MNAKEELLSRLSRLHKEVKIIAAKIEVDLDWFDEGEILPQKNHILKMGYSEEEFVKFLDGLETIEYDGYTRDIKGTVWLSDGSWMQRDWNDRGAWWERYAFPPIPKELIN